MTSEKEAEKIFETSRKDPERKREEIISIT
jgi:hypothetical protein